MESKLISVRWVDLPVNFTKLALAGHCYNNEFRPIGRSLIEWFAAEYATEMFLSKGHTSLKFTEEQLTYVLLKWGE